MGNMKEMCTMHKVAVVLLWIGGLNWGLVGLGMLLKGNWNVVNLIFGGWPTLEAIIYLLVGVSAVLMLTKKNCKACKMSPQGERKM